MRPGTGRGVIRSISPIARHVGKDRRTVRAVVAAQPAVAAAASCHDVYFVSARGSGEPYTTD